MNKLSINKSAQAGFTLIELIVVIVILGILAATALPKFTSLTGEARVASLQGARGAMSTTAAMAHGKYLVNTTGTALTTLAIEGSIINFPSGTTAVLTGYPLADAGFVGASGLGNIQDYTPITAGSSAVAATTTAPLVPANSVAVIPSGIANTATAVTCFVTYTTPTTANAAPVLSGLPTAANCQ